MKTVVYFIVETLINPFLEVCKQRLDSYFVMDALAEMGWTG